MNTRSHATVPGSTPWARTSTAPTYVPRIPEWRSQAACISAPEGEIFTERGPSPARAINRCLNECTVREQCLQVALDSPVEPSGLWGGLPTAEVRRLWAERHPHLRADSARRAHELRTAV